MTVERVFLLYDDQDMLHRITAESELWGVRIETVDSMEECLAAARGDPVEKVVALRFQADTVFLYVNRLRADFPAAGVMIMRKDSALVRCARAYRLPRHRVRQGRNRRPRGRIRGPPRCAIGICWRTAGAWPRPWDTPSC